MQTSNFSEYVIAICFEAIFNDIELYSMHKGIAH